ncbi:MAG: hypothetical protein KC502_07190 [Myxococcales bacterium]|nr:hypothetical protein [Myxococcales bacterium]
MRADNASALGDRSYGQACVCEAQAGRQVASSAAGLAGSRDASSAERWDGTSRGSAEQAVDRWGQRDSAYLAVRGTPAIQRALQGELQGERCGQLGERHERGG